MIQSHEIKSRTQKFINWKIFHDPMCLFCMSWVFFGSQLLFRDLEIMHHLQLSPTDYDLVAIDAEF